MKDRELEREIANYLWERIPTFDALQCDMWASGILSLIVQQGYEKLEEMG